MSDVGGPGPEQQLSEEELRAYLSELRDAPVGEIIAQVITVLANGAQVKLGRNDARVLIDSIDAVKAASASVLPAEFVSQIDDLLGQLRMAQVEGEREIARRRAAGESQESGDVTSPSPGDQSGTQPGASTPPRPPSTQRPDSGQGGGSRLWTPGS